MAFEAMFQPIQIGKLTIRNRVLSTAHAEVYATDGGMTTERYVKYLSLIHILALRPSASKNSSLSTPKPAR